MSSAQQALGCSELFGATAAAVRVLQCWREQGKEAALQAIQLEPSHGPLMLELDLRLRGEAGPRLLLDGVWFSRPAGGISRVWNQILRCWQLPGLFTEQSPLLVLDRESCFSRSASFPSIEMGKVNPLDCKSVAEIAGENAAVVRDWGADVFLSSWISFAGFTDPVCPEVVLVHDCMPERSSCPEDLRLLRRRWLLGASTHLAVSAHTAADLASLLSQPIESIPWCHSAPDLLFASTVQDPGTDQLWKRLKTRVGITEPFVLLPATSAVGSYKNPELVLRALQQPTVQMLQLLISGVGAEQRAAEFENQVPSLRGRILAVGLSDLELALVYRHALAVVVPSRIEGFGLPVIEVMAAGGIPLIAESRGLREAGGEAAPRFVPDQPSQLTVWLELLLDPSSGAWLKMRLEPRVQKRLSRLHLDLLGLALLAQVRRAAGAL